MKCGMNETNATVKISPLSIKQFRHARTIPILSSIYFRPYIYIYTHFMHISIAYGVSLTFVQASPIFPSFLRSMEILEICNIHVSEKERKREGERETTAKHCFPRIDLAPFRISLFFRLHFLPLRSYVWAKEKKKEEEKRRKKKLHRVNSEPGVIRSLN